MKAIVKSQGGIVTSVSYEPETEEEKKKMEADLKESKENAKPKKANAAS